MHVKQNPNNNILEKKKEVTMSLVKEGNNIFYLPSIKVYLFLSYRQ